MCPVTLQAGHYELHGSDALALCCASVCTVCVSCDGTGTGVSVSLSSVTPTLPKRRALEPALDTVEVAENWYANKVIIPYTY